MWPINWPGNVRVVFEETIAMTGDGHQALAFSLGLWSRPHWVRFAGGWPWNCLFRESFRFVLVLEHLFQVFYSGVQFSHPCAIRVLISSSSVWELFSILSTMAIFVSTSWRRCGWWYNRSFLLIWQFLILLFSASFWVNMIVCKGTCFLFARWTGDWKPVWVLLTRQFLVPLRKKRA